MGLGPFENLWLGFQNAGMQQSQMKHYTQAPGLQVAQMKQSMRDTNAMLQRDMQQSGIDQARAEFKLAKQYAYANSSLPNTFGGTLSVTGTGSSATIGMGGCGPGHPGQYLTDRDAWFIPGSDPRKSTNPLHRMEARVSMVSMKGRDALRAA